MTNRVVRSSNRHIINNIPFCLPCGATLFGQNTVAKDPKLWLISHPTFTSSWAVRWLPKSNPFLFKLCQLVYSEPQMIRLDKWGKSRMCLLQHWWFTRPFNQTTDSATIDSGGVSLLCHLLSSSTNERMWWCWPGITPSAAVVFVAVQRTTATRLNFFLNIII